jgi:hypothetical protein
MLSHLFTSSFHHRRPANSENADGVGSRFRRTRFPYRSSLPENDSRLLVLDDGVGSRFRRTRFPYRSSLPENDSRPLWAIPPLLASLAVLVLLAGSAVGQSYVPAAGRSAPEPPEVIREIFVPFEDLNVLLEGDVRRVFLTREQYDELLAKAKKVTPDSPAPHAAIVLSAEYDAVIEDNRARLTGVLELEVLADGLQAIPLELSGVGLYAARLDDGQAAIGRNDCGQAVLLVTGPGRFRLTLEMVTPLETSAAQQSLAFRVPAAPASRLRLTVPGNVEIKSGAAVVRRQVDEAADVTRFDLLLPAGPTSLVMSLNNRLLRRQRVIVARSVLVDEITAACERLHATVSLAVLHGATDRFRFVLPDGFEPAEVLCPLMARWEVRVGEGRRELEIVLREPTTETVVLHLSATRTPVVLTDWTLPRLEPLDVAGQVAVVGVVVEQGLEVRSLTPQGMIPVDHSVLTAALPDTVFRVEPGTPRVRTVAAFYAPGGEYALQADFARPAPRLQATTHLLLVMDQTGHRVHGGLVLAPEVERLFEVRFQGPQGWHVSQVTDTEGNPLPVERYEDTKGAPSVRVRLEPGVSPGEPRTVLFQATHVPPGWLGDWPEKTIEFPRFVIQDADRDLGAIAIRTEDDLSVRPDQLEDLVPLDENEKAKYGLAGIVSNLAYRYDRQPYGATLVVRRETPTVTARSYSFVQLAPAGMTVQYELVYDIREARTRRLSFVMPVDTPSSLLLQGLDGIVVKEFHHEDTEAGRRWTAVLAEPASGPVRLAVGFQQPLPSGDQTDYNVCRCRWWTGVIYQTGGRGRRGARRPGPGTEDRRAARRHRRIGGGSVPGRTAAVGRLRIPRRAWRHARRHPPPRGLRLAPGDRPARPIADAGGDRRHQHHRRAVSAAHQGAVSWRSDCPTRGPNCGPRIASMAGRSRRRRPEPAC